MQVNDIQDRILPSLKFLQYSRTESRHPTTSHSHFNSKTGFDLHRACNTNSQLFYEPRFYIMNHIHKIFNIYIFEYIYLYIYLFTSFFRQFTITDIKGILRIYICSNKFFFIFNSSPKIKLLFTLRNFTFTLLKIYFYIIMKREESLVIRVL